MKKIYVNLKRFDIPAEFGGVNRLADSRQWAGKIIEDAAITIGCYADKAQFVLFFPESHIHPAVYTREKMGSFIGIGCQSVFRDDVSASGNFGAFTSNRTAKSMKALGVSSTIIGHCEERRDKTEILRRGMDLLSGSGATSEKNALLSSEVNKIMNEQIKCALSAGLKVLYCVGESSDELDDWENVIQKQLQSGLKDTDLSEITIAYEPLWAIGPGKTPPDRKYILKIARFIKQQFHGIDVVYGGGLKSGNAAMLASISEIDGGLIALTRFSGEIGFYPDEFLEIVDLYLNN